MSAKLAVREGKLLRVAYKVEPGRRQDVAADRLRREQLEIAGTAADLQDSPRHHMLEHPPVDVAVYGAQDRLAIPDFAIG